MNAKREVFTPLMALTRQVVVGVSAIYLAHFALANDISQGVTPGPFSTLPTGTPQRVSITQAAVRIVGQQVTVSLTARAPVPDQAKLLITGPLFGWLGESEPYPDRHFPELRVASNGVALTGNDSFEAFVGKTDVSALLRQAGVNPWLIADTPPFVSTEDIKSEVLSKLVRAGALIAAGDDYLARWRAQRTLSVALRSGQAITITYRLRPAYAMLPRRALVGAGLGKRYCISGGRMQKFLHGSDATAQFVVTQYTIPVTVNHRPPLSVRLSVTPQPGVALVATCASRSTGMSGSEGLTDIAVKPDQRGQLNILTIEYSTPSRITDGVQSRQP